MLNTSELTSLIEKTIKSANKEIQEIQELKINVLEYEEKMGKMLEEIEKIFCETKDISEKMELYKKDLSTKHEAIKNKELELDRTLKRLESKEKEVTSAYKYNINEQINNFKKEANEMFETFNKEFVEIIEKFTSKFSQLEKIIETTEEKIKNLDEIDSMLSSEILKWLDKNKERIANSITEKIEEEIFS